MMLLRRSETGPGPIGWTAAVLLLAFFSSPGATQDPAAAVSVRDLVEQLASGTYEQRENAARQIIGRGRGSIPSLLDSIQRQQLESSYRAVTILRDLCLSPDIGTWHEAQAALEQVAGGDNRMAALFAQDILQSQVASAEQRLVRLGSKRLTGRTTLTLPPSWTGGKDGLINLRWLPHLRTLRIEGAALPPEALAHLQYTPQLQHLVIVNVDVDDHLFDYLRYVPNLETLYLSGTKITDQGIKALSGRDKLTWLEIQQTAVSDASLAVLSSLKGLRGLQVTGTRISTDGIRQLQKALPRASIFYVDE